MANSKLLLAAGVFLICVSLAVIKIGSKNSRKSKSVGQVAPPVYNGYVIATKWTNSVCSLKTCNSPLAVSKTVFNLHGLWPTDHVNNLSPANCYNSPFTLNNLPASTINLVTTYWNSLYGAMGSLVGHEWTKHGTCWRPALTTLALVHPVLKPYVQSAITAFGIIDQIDRQAAYIKMSVAMSKLYNVFDALRTHQIVPSTDKYEKQAVADAIKNHFKVDSVHILCEGDYLMEVRLCTDLNFNPINCLKDKNFCPDQLLYLP